MVIPFTIIARHARAILVTAFVPLALLSVAQTAPSDPPYSVVDRGAFYRVLQRTVSVTNVTTGEVSQQVQSYTELADGMNYLSNGQWIEAQDLVEAARTYGDYIHFCADDYTWSGADDIYFYFSWCDRTRKYQNVRPDADVAFAKIRQ